MARKLAPMHPGEVLREEFLLPLGLSAGALAKDSRAAAVSSKLRAEHCRLLPTSSRHTGRGCAHRCAPVVTNVSRASRGA